MCAHMFQLYYIKEGITKVGSAGSDIPQVSDTTLFFNNPIYLSYSDHMRHSLTGYSALWGTHTRRALQLPEFK